MLNISKLSTKEMIAKLAKMTGMNKGELETKTRDELKATLAGEIELQTRVAEDAAFIDDVNLFGDDGADEDIVVPEVKEILPEDCIATEPKGRTAKYDDKKLRKAFRHYARRIANKKNVNWVQQGEDYIVDDELISWAKFVEDHAE